MSGILIFAGTTEGRRLSEALAASGIGHTLCVATEYGEIVLKEHPLVQVRRGRMNREEIRAYIDAGDFQAVVDATHPYAEAVTENIKGAMEGMSLPYLRLKRRTKEGEGGAFVVRFDTNEACAEALERTEGNILLTTGSKELRVYCASEELRKRLYVRVLPGLESLSLCLEQGISGKQILALQGPFTAELNEALLRQYRIGCLVTKASGRTGGYREKLEAAEKLGIPVYVVGHPEEEEGLSFGQVCRRLELLLGKPIAEQEKMEILLAGAGMGGKSGLTLEARRAAEEADILLGAERLLSGYRPRVEKKPFYRASQIIPYLKELQDTGLGGGSCRVTVLFSGDCGFYSGCPSLYRGLKREIDDGGLRASVRVLPGISSVAYLAACIGESYQDAAVYSTHGKELSNLAGKIRRREKTFLITSGAGDVRRLGELLLEAGLEDCEIFAGYRLSYPEQQLRRLGPAECCQVWEEGLYTCFIRNPRPQEPCLTPGIGDGEFLRDKVPMTKEEVRQVSICKLKLRRDSVLYDVGSGTGSVAVEAAGLWDGIQVFAAERKEEAVSLIERNREKFGLENITVLQGTAPECLSGLPAATHAFIGGSGGRMREILDALYEINPRMRVVINAVSLETICEIRELLERYPIRGEELVQLQVSRAREAGQYHLMQAENPVWVCAFYFREKSREE